MKKSVVPVLIGLILALVPWPAVAPPAVASSAPPGASAYHPITPNRLADTRAEMGAHGFTRTGPSTIRVQVTGRAGIAGGATAVVLNVASVDAAAAGFVTAYPAGSPRPLAASLNVDAPGRIVANLTTVRLSADGAVDIYSNVAMDLVVDVAGTYSPADGPVAAGRLVTIPGGARRAYDSRTTKARLGPGGTQIVDLSPAGVPADAVAVAINLAAVDGDAGFWTAYPTGDSLPLASSLNLDGVRQTRNSQGIVRLNPGTRSISVYSYGGGDLVVDVVGWFTGSNAPASLDGLFVPTAPTRVLDSRDSSTYAPWGATTLEFETRVPAGISAAAVAMNIAITEPWNVGFVTAFPAGVSRPLAANLNVTALDQIISNHAIVRNGSRGVSLYTQNGAHMIVDVAGWYLGAPDASVLPVPTIPTFDPTWAIAIRAPGLVAVDVGYHRNINTVLDRGMAGLWSGSGRLGAPDTNIFFAHRTSHGGPFRSIDRLTAGTTFEVVGEDGAIYTYLVTRTNIIWPTSTHLFHALAGAGEFTTTLVACHPPGSTRYRLTITGRLIGARRP